MPDEPKAPQQRNISDALREAVEKTVTASADALDEVSRRSREARETMSQRAGEVGQRAGEARDTLGQRGQEASAGLAGKVADAVEGRTPVARDELRELERQVAELSRRVAGLEAKSPPEPHPKVEP